jgi:phage shock protein PspC (stress-responsive transcriptional regulator)
MSVNPRRLYRSRRDRRIAGVAGGVAEYLEVDPTVIRVLWIISIFFGGFGLLLYIIMAFIVPLEPMAGPTGGGPMAGSSVGSTPSSSVVPGWQAPAGSAPAAPAASATPAASAPATPSTAPASADAGAAPTADDTTEPDSEPSTEPTSDSSADR